MKTRMVRFAVMACVMLGGTSATVRAQGTPAARDTATTRPGTSLFASSDATALLVAALVSVEVAHFDTKIARYTQTPSVQGDSSRLNMVKRLTKANETTLTAVAIAGYGLGRVFHSPGVTDVSAHVGEALLITNVLSQAIRGPFGRARPYVTHDAQNSDFHIGKGFTSYDYRSMPSLHSASAFAAAAALTAEVGERHPSAALPVGLLLYSAATIPGLTRMYLDQHWASDVVMGAFLGAFIGRKVVTHAHANPRNRLDRILLHTSVAPNGSGGAALAFNVPLGH